MLDPKKETAELFEMVSRSRTLVYEAMAYARDLGGQHDQSRAKLREARGLLKEAATRITKLEQAIEEGRTS